MGFRSSGSRAMQVYDESYAHRYRQSDEAEAASANHAHYCSILDRISASFGRSIDVLDLGCGTGRYFHCLRNVQRLTGVDVSFDMLRQARSPVRTDDVRIERIDLVCGDLLDLDFGAERFDFIYSIGVLGEHSPLDAMMCGRIHDSLKPGGVLFFTVMEREVVTARGNPGRWIAQAVYPGLPESWQRRLDRRWWTCRLTRPELLDVLRQSPFTDPRIARHVTRSSRWRGAHFDCEAVKRTR